MQKKKKQDNNYNGMIDAEQERISMDKKFDPEKGIWGIAVSGGGIRSASFGLGVMQALVNKDLFEKLDYMSTVSGGGYLGAALSYALHVNKDAGTGPENFPLGIKKAPGAKTGDLGGGSGSNDNKLLNFIRMHGAYLTPTKKLDIISFSAVVVRSMIMSLFVYISFFTILMTLCLFLMYKIVYVSGNLKVVNRFVENISGGSIVEFNQGLMLVAGLIIIGIIIIMGFIFSLSTFFKIKDKIKDSSGRLMKAVRYSRFVSGQMWIGSLLKISFYCIILGTLPFVVKLLGSALPKLMTAGSSTLFGAAVGIWQYMKARDNKKSSGISSDIMIYTGAFALFYGLLLFAYFLATDIFLWDKIEYFPGNILVEHYAYDFRHPVLFFILTALAFVFGFFVNLNYIGPHYLWRSRLMEAFLPDKTAVNNNSWGPSKEADHTMMKDICNEKKPRPYHIINTNVILSNSNNIAYKGRAGDNFILSPLFCGSDATGWKKTADFNKNASKRGVTLASAMATSAAALNPNAGVAGEGVTRNMVVSILLSMLNLRLGYWVTNPGQTKKNWMQVPNFFRPGLTTEIFRSGLTEKSKNLLLSDGGHFENLALYELIRRKLKLIIVSDGGSDPEFNFDDLANAIEKVRVDFGTRIEFKNSYHPDDILPGTSGNSSFEKKYNISKRGFAIAEIMYSDDPSENGLLIYIKLAMIQGLPTDVYSYKGVHPEFPHQSTADQFFDEKQFEAYRELGYYNCKQMLNSDFGRKKFDIKPVVEIRSELSRTVNVRINGKTEIIATLNYPVDLNDLGTRVAEVLKGEYEKNYSVWEKDFLTSPGIVEADAENTSYRFTYEFKSYPFEPDVIHCYVKPDHREGDKLWHSCTHK